jgi:hypothetical protein
MAVRFSHNQAGNLAAACYLFGYDPALYELELKRYGRREARRYLQGLVSRDGQSYFDPVRARHTMTTGASNWTYGAWVEFIASTTNPMWVTHLTILNEIASSSQQLQAELGIGSAGNEQAIARCAFPCVVGTFGFMQDAEWVRPAYVPPGSRVAVRLAGRPGITSTDYDGFLTMQEFV